MESCGIRDGRHSVQGDSEIMSREEEMKRSLEKAEVLIEALPYIQRFNRKIIVVKYGGSAMVDEGLKRNVDRKSVV